MPQISNLTIIQINDTHGYLAPHPELVWTELVRSGSKAATKQ